MINIFAKQAFLNTSSNTPFISKEASYKGNGHLQREDVNIYVKPHVRPGDDFEFTGSKNYIDIIDGWGLIPLLERHPEVGVIACSKQDEQKLKKALPNNKVVFIPQHSCNYNGERRSRKGISSVGIIGTEDAFAHIPEGLESELRKRHIGLVKFSKFFSRQDIIDFYKSIDVQLVWRPYRMRLSNPLKIVNAASFGIPSIVYDESVFEEVKGCYIGVRDLTNFLVALDTMGETGNLLYDKMRHDCLKKAEDYHISKVAELYRQL